ncbi:L-type lectin-domain containing receptor kinase IX.1-like [Eucalyptus grandis]|uniref:L-type lectin-domain containing receptor kinase IX.1-like n=1 Tax=Eucalyptus grandis TaxID=71139 RepID=UPI00192ECC3D|nr:L-type lectin-domain containing receptor kinase IX.1-like [Eucalyptus grandis]
MAPKCPSVPSYGTWAILLPFVSSLSFNISSFDTNGGDIILEGVAKIVSGSVVLTEGSLAPSIEVGHMRYAEPLGLWDSATRKHADFSTRFSFTIDTMNYTLRGDGIGFFLAPVDFSIPPNSAGGYLGLFNSTTYHDGPQYQIVVIEFESRHSEKVFMNEVKILSRMLHRNLVQFIRWCREEGEFLLVYEYMPNGSLDNHLFGTRKSLPWDVRYKIALGLALALNYLHEDLEQCVLHRDVKAANILLDTNFNTKLGDFGVAKLIDPQFRTRTTDVVGTYGYLAPEYFGEGKATKESDMFSFTVVALEIACGRRTYQEGEFHIPLHKWVWQLYLAGNMLEAVDETLGSSFDGKEMECLMMVGLWCVHPDPKMRPKAGHVIRFLQLEVPVPEFPRGTYEAFPSYQLSALRIESSSSLQEISSFSAR